MATNPNFERQKEIREDIEARFAEINPARFFTPVKVSDGKQILEKKFATMPKVPTAVKNATFSEIDKFRSVTGKYRIPQHRIDISMTMSEYRQIMNGGEYDGFSRSAAQAMAVAVAKTICLNNVSIGGASDFPYYGLIDPGTGDGTASRPLTAGAGTKAGAWTTATYGGSDISSIIGLLEQFKVFDDGTPLLLLYPAVANIAMRLLVPDQSGQVVTFRELAQRWYGAIESVAEDDDGTSILTGNTETSTDFELVAVNPNWFLALYDIPPIVRFWENPAQDMAYIQYENHLGLMPIPYEHNDGKIYKAMSYIDGCGS